MFTQTMSPRPQPARSASTLFGCVLVLALFSAAMPAATVPAPLLEPDQVQTGRLLLQADDTSPHVAAPTLDTRVNIDVTGMVARVDVEQRFSNPGQTWVNGVYVFPLPETAAVDHLSMQVGERVIEGHIKAREEARRIYDQARTTGTKASLVEQQRPNLFTSRIANIGPGETIVVRIQYQQAVAYQQGRFSLRFPLTPGIRYIPGTRLASGFDGGGWSFNTDQVSDASEITPPTVEPGQNSGNPVSLDVQLRTGFPLARIDSPYHAIVSTPSGPGKYRVRLAQGSVPADRDFELTWEPQAGQTPQAALFTQQDGADHYALLMLLPPIEPQEGNGLLPREVIYVVDTSGSMAGTSIEQARRALLLGLDRLRPGDSFNVVQFNSTTDALAPRALPVTPGNLARARSYVHALRADGGTEIAMALRAVLHGERDGTRLRQVVFLTDGSVGNEEALFTVIHERLGDSRLYTVGIGSAPNSYFMREAADLGRGTFTHIGEVGEVQERMDELFAKLEFPVLSDIRLGWDGGGTADYWPNPVRDLYLHEPLVVSLKLGGGEQTLHIDGRMNGQAWSKVLPVHAGGTGSGLDVLWARNRIRSLDQQRSRGVPADRIKTAITELGLKHHIVTAYTSLVAVDVTPSKPSDRRATDATVPNLKPAGWAMAAPPGRLPQTATAAPLQLLLGTLGLLPIALGRVLGRRAGA